MDQFGACSLFVVRGVCDQIVGNQRPQARPHGSRIGDRPRNHDESRPYVPSPSLDRIRWIGRKIQPRLEPIKGFQLRGGQCLPGAPLGTIRTKAERVPPGTRSEVLQSYTGAIDPDR